MAHQPIEELLPSANFSVYRLVRMASNRALELADGRPCLIDNPTTDKATTTALEEIAQGKIVSTEAKELTVKLLEEKAQAEKEAVAKAAELEPVAEEV